MTGNVPKLRLGLRNAKGPDVTVVLNGEPVSTLYGGICGLSGIIPHPGGGGTRVQDFSLNNVRSKIRFFNQVVERQIARAMRDTRRVICARPMEHPSGDDPLFELVISRGEDGDLRLHVTVEGSSAIGEKIFGRPDFPAGFLEEPKMAFFGDLSVVCAPNDPHAAIYQRLGVKVTITSPDETPSL
ncbi:hypothetical protein KUV57_11130 [Epibacterium sp. DP7N7-1]|nr:hypothetical protein [Epibacterium sp. DP7N7-1]